MSKKKSLFSLTAIIIILIMVGLVIMLYRNNNKIEYVEDSDYLYDSAIEYLKEETISKYNEKNEKEDYQVFLEYKGFGISKKDNTKYAYMKIAYKACYVENGKLKTDISTIGTFKFKAEMDKIVDYETAKDGGYYVSSVKKMFPNDIENEILKFNMKHEKIEEKTNEHYSYLKSTDYIPTITEKEFTAEIMEICNNGMLVKPDTNSVEIKLSDIFSVNIFNDKTNKLYKAGNKVKITYNGEISTSYPAQINAIKVELEN